jgi:hypothetical protein
MRAKLDFIRQALKDDLGISFKVPIAFIIPKTPMTSLFSDSSLISCGGNSTDLWVWWYLPFPDKIVQQTLLHLKNNVDEKFISIHFLEYITIIINYCASLTVFLESKITDNAHPVVLCVTDNISDKKWTMHNCKKLIIGRAQNRFFWGLLTGSDIGINAKWISTKANKIADEISRVKKSKHSNHSSTCYDFSKLKQEYVELKHCRFFHLSPDLLSMLWEIMLTKKCPNLRKVLTLNHYGLCKLGT